MPQPTRGWRALAQGWPHVTGSPRVKTADRATRSALRPAPGRPRQHRAHAAHQRALDNTAQLDATASNRTHHRCQERMQPWQPAMVDSLHKAGVVSRVPCSSRYASAFGTDRNTYLTSTHQRSERIPWGNCLAGGRETESRRMRNLDFELKQMIQRNRHGSGDATSKWPGRRRRAWAKAIAAGRSPPWRWAWMSPRWRMR